jgi:hypothetical protein
VRDGFSHWKNGCISIISHETSIPHVIASMKLKIRESVLPLLPSFDQHRKSNVALNREIFKQLISITVFLGQHSFVPRP